MALRPRLSTGLPLSYSFWAILSQGLFMLPYNEFTSDGFHKDPHLPPPAGGRVRALPCRESTDGGGLYIPMIECADCDRKYDHKVEDGIQDHP